MYISQVKRRYERRLILTGRRPWFLGRVNSNDGEKRQDREGKERKRRRGKRREKGKGKTVTEYGPELARHILRQQSVTSLGHTIDSTWLFSSDCSGQFMPGIGTGTRTHNGTRSLCRYTNAPGYSSIIVALALVILLLLSFLIVKRFLLTIEIGEEIASTCVESRCRPHWRRGSPDAEPDTWRVNIRN